MHENLQGIVRCRGNQVGLGIASEPEIQLVAPKIYPPCSFLTFHTPHLYQNHPCSDFSYHFHYLGSEIKGNSGYCIDINFVV